jgi:hypothetical protein
LQFAASPFLLYFFDSVGHSWLTVEGFIVV